MVQRWAGSHDLPRSDRTLGPQVPVLTTVTLLSRYISTSTCRRGDPTALGKLSLFSHRAQVLEVREVVRRPRSFQSTLACTARLTIGSQARFPLTYFCQCLLLQRFKIAESSDVGSDTPIVKFAGRFVQLLILRHGSDDAFFEPCREGLDRLALHCGLSVDVKDVRGASRPVAFGESRDCAVVQELDPFDGPMDAIAIADCKAGEAFILLIPGGYLFPRFFLEMLESLVEVSDSLSVLFHIPVMGSVLLLDSFDEGCGELAKSDGISDVETLYEVSCGRWGDGVSAGGTEVGDRHEGRCVGSRGLIGCHGDVGVWGAEWERVR